MDPVGEIAGSTRCATCATSLLRAVLPGAPFEYEDIRHFICEQCKEPKTGDRWWCDRCSCRDICFNCLPDAPLSPCARPRHFARRLLRLTSEREIDQGLPCVGVLFTTTSHLQVLRNRIEQALKDSNTKDYKMGFQKVFKLPSDPDVVVAHMSSHTAINVKLYPEICFPSGPIAEVDNPDTWEELYFGVRTCDPVFGGIGNGDHFLSVPPLSPDVSPPASRFTFAEIFAGIGGFRLGLEALGGKCVFTSELNAAARDTMALNYPPTVTAGDITGVYANQMPDFDILSAGFPCQSFSVRGKQGGLQDPRGQLFRELIRIMIVKRPKAVLFENVPGLVYLDGGRQNKTGEPISRNIGDTFKYILGEFEAAGYNMTWRIIDAKHWLPQNRQRVYMVGFRSDLGIQTDAHWPAAGETCPGPGAHLTVRDILERDPHCLAPLTQEQWDRMLLPEYIERTNRWKGLMGGVRSKEISLDDKAPTLISGYKNAHNETTRYICHDIDGNPLPLPRFLSPRECCRIMGFPESFKIPVQTESARGKPLSGAKSESQFYVQIGNAVCPPVIQAIGCEMLTALGI